MKTKRIPNYGCHKVTTGGTAIPPTGHDQSLDGDLQHSSALAQSPEGNIDYRGKPSRHKLIRNRTASRSKSDDRLPVVLRYRVKTSLRRRPCLILAFSHSHPTCLLSGFLSPQVISRMHCVICVGYNPSPE